MGRNTQKRLQVRAKVIRSMPDVLKIQVASQTLHTFAQPSHW
jgi:hypothetical protein